MQQIIFMRHGRSLLNDGYESTESNNVLTWHGVLATMAEAEPLKKLNIDTVLSSPIPRAYQTAMTAVSAMGRGIPITQHAELEEMRSHPENLHVLKPYETDAEMDLWKNNIDAVPAWSQECQRDVYIRLRSFLMREVPARIQDGSMLIVSHYFAIRGIRAWLEHGDPEKMTNFKPRNSAPIAYRAQDILNRIKDGRKPVRPIH